jgi:hypothetical protein
VHCASITILTSVSTPRYREYYVTSYFTDDHDVVGIFLLCVRFR